VRQRVGPRDKAGLCPLCGFEIALARCRDVATGPGVVGPRGHIELRLRVGSPVLPKRRNGTGVIGPCLQTGRLPWSWTPRSGAVPIAAWGAGRVLGSCVQYGPPGWRVVAVQPGLGASRVPQRRRGRCRPLPCGEPSAKRTLVAEPQRARLSACSQSDASAWAQPHVAARINTTHAPLTTS
jgi:hypothetical protein